MIANAHRGTPIHMLWTREEDFIGTTYRAMGVARLKAALDAEGWPIALEVRTAMQEGGFGPEASFHVTSRYHAPNYRYSNHTTKFHVPVGTRRGVGQAAHEFYRESFFDELARVGEEVEKLQTRKGHALSVVSEPGFWDREDRFAILAEAALSYLGLGTQPPYPSWGLMLKEAQNFLSMNPWFAVFPGAAIALTVLGLNLLGDGLRDLLDPKTA